MKLLLDTHIVFWAVASPASLPAAASALLLSGQHDLFVSLASAWEIAIKVGHGKWDAARPLLMGFEGIVADAGFEMIPITLIEVRRAGLIVADHRDSFDRLLASQAIENDLLVLTVDEAFKSLGCAIAG